MKHLNQSFILTWRLKDADNTLRLFITMFLFVLTVGYSIGLLFVEHTTQGTPKGLSEEYRGTPETVDAVELKYEKSAGEMYVFLHNHILSLAIVFFIVGVLFYFSSEVSDRIKKFLIVEPFVALVTTFGGIWLVRMVSEHFSWFVFVSGISMVGCYFVTVGLVLKELWFRRKV